MSGATLGKRKLVAADIIQNPKPKPKPVDNTLMTIKANRHLISNFWDDVLKPLVERAEPLEKFEVISKLFCDGF